MLTFTPMETAPNSTPRVVAVACGVRFRALIRTAPVAVMELLSLMAAWTVGDVVAMAAAPLPAMMPPARAVASASDESLLAVACDRQIVAAGDLPIEVGHRQPWPRRS